MHPHRTHTGLLTTTYTNSHKMHSTSTDKHSHGPNSRLNQSNFKGESEQSGHPNYGVWCGKLVRHLRKTLIKTPGSGVQWWSGSLHLRLIWKHEIANSWPSNAVCASSLRSAPVIFCVRAPSNSEEWSFAHGNRRCWIMSQRMWSSRCSRAWQFMSFSFLYVHKT